MPVSLKFCVGTPSRTQAAGLVCGCCFKISDVTLSKCAVCRRVVYCSKECQKTDWKEHKLDCKKIAQVNAYDASKGHTLSDLSRRLDYLIAEEEARAKTFDPDAVYSNHPLIAHGIKCQVCFRTPFHDSNHTLTPCGECKLAWWCSPECHKLFKKHHTPEQCAALGTVRATDSVRIAYAISRHSPRRIMLCTETAQRVYIPPSSLKGWSDYHARIMPQFDPLARQVAREFIPTHPDALRAVKLLGMDSASIALTILGALGRTIPDADLKPRRTLCIHIVGAEVLETLTQGVMEDIQHYLPNLRTLTVVYVGPNLLPNSDDSDTRDVACETCTPRGRRRFSIRRYVTYHEFAKTETYKANPPDLVAGFNTGMGEVQTELWTPTIRLILEHNVPAVFTSYTHFEALHDKFFLSDLHANFIVPMTKNVWHGVVPSPSERHEKYGTEHFSNHYWQIVQGVTAK